MSSSADIDVIVDEAQSQNAHQSSMQVTDESTAAAGISEVGNSEISESDRVVPIKRKINDKDGRGKEKLKSKGGPSAYFDNEAELSGDDEDPEDDDENHDQDGYASDGGFVVGDHESDDDSNAEITLEKPKPILRRLKKKTGVVDIEDQDLLLDNMSKSISFSREPPNDDVDDDPQDDYDDEPANPTNNAALDDYDDDDDDDGDSFIADEDEDDNDDDATKAAKLQQKKIEKLNKKNQKKSGRKAATADEMRELHAIFGERALVADDSDEETGEDDPTTVLADFNDDPEAAARNLIRKRYDTQVLVENFMMEKDEIIRQLDIPERFQHIPALQGRFDPSCVFLSTTHSVLFILFL